MPCRRWLGPLQSWHGSDRCLTTGDELVAVVDVAGSSRLAWKAIAVVTDASGPALDLAAAYVELQRLLLQSPDVDAFLSQIAVLAAAVTSPPSSCGVTLRRNGEVSTVAASSLLASQADEIQYGRGQGPCLHSMRTGEVVHIPDLAADDRWTDYKLNALAQGVRSSLSTPLFVDDQPVGALNLYTDTLHTFTPADITKARAFADQASAALTLVLRHAEHLDLQEQLRNALASRAVIDQALGIIMGQQRCNATDAFAVLRHAS